MGAICGGTSMVSAMMANMASPSLRLLVVFFRHIICLLIAKSLQIPTIIAVLMLLSIAQVKNAGR